MDYGTRILNEVIENVKNMTREEYLALHESCKDSDSRERIIDPSIFDNIDRDSDSVFEHDCDQCQFVGRHDNKDLYFCASEPTVVARYGNDGSDYMSGLIFATPTGNPHLYAALLLANEKGLIK